jgi:hypothetical protein
MGVFNIFLKDFVKIKIRFWSSGYGRHRPIKDRSRDPGQNPGARRDCQRFEEGRLSGGIRAEMAVDVTKKGKGVKRGKGR